MTSCHEAVFWVGLAEKLVEPAIQCQVLPQLRRPEEHPPQLGENIPHPSQVESVSTRLMTISPENLRGNTGPPANDSLERSATAVGKLMSYQAMSQPWSGIQNTPADKQFRQGRVELLGLKPP